MTHRARLTDLNLLVCKARSGLSRPTTCRVQISLAKIPSVFRTPEVRARNGTHRHLACSAVNVTGAAKPCWADNNYKHKHKGRRLVFHKHAVRISEALTDLIRCHLCGGFAGAVVLLLMDDRCNRYSAWRTRT